VRRRHRRQLDPRQRPPDCAALSRVPHPASVQETAKRWGKSDAFVRRLCLDARVEGAFRVLTFEASPNSPILRLVWRIPADIPNPARQNTRLTDEQKNQMVKRALKGEQRTALAREYGIIPAYVHRLLKRATTGRAPGPRGDRLAVKPALQALHQNSLMTQNCKL
jgi:hypothetical protein